MIPAADLGDTDWQAVECGADLSRCEHMEGFHRAREVEDDDLAVRPQEVVGQEVLAL